jgi:hypothetical protein
MRFTITLEPRHALPLFSLLILVIGLSIVIASPVGTLPNPGHPGSDIQPGTIAEAQLADNAVGSPEIIDGAVGNADLANDANSLAKASGGAMAASSGNIGIGLSGAPTQKVEVNGNVKATAFIGDGSQLTGISAGASFPAGLVAFFNLASCPSGWSELTAARGLYIVGLPSGGTLGAAVGTALTNQENRPVGQHTHTITDPGHSHTYSKYIVASTYSGSSQATPGSNAQTSVSTTGITINPAGSVAGTNAPYIQLLICQKQ